MQLLLTNATVVLPDRLLPGHTVWVDTGTIVAVAPDDSLTVPASVERIDLAGRFLGPGFVDIHCHAGGGVWLHDDPMAAADCQLRHGTTSMLGTTILHATQAEQVAALATIADAVDQGLTRNVIGIHMEGPYLNPAHGAYRDLSRVPRRVDWMEFVHAGKGWLRTMTIAPEIDGVAEMVYGMQDATGGRMRFSVGHSRALPEQIYSLIPAGLRLATHLFNATGCAHEPSRYAGTREVGVDEAVLLEHAIMAEVIADRGGLHVRPELIRLLWQVKGPAGVIIVTDATAADGAPGESGPTSAGEVLDVRFNEDGDLAGSELTMDAAFNNLVRHAGITVVEAWRAASYNPASALGMLDSIGQIAPGCSANLIVASPGIDEAIQIDDVWLAGQLLKEST